MLIFPESCLSGTRSHDLMLIPLPLCGHSVGRPAFAPCLAATLLCYGPSIIYAAIVQLPNSQVSQAHH